MEIITLTDGRKVYKSDYVTAKTKSLVEFGYNTVTKKEVSEQVDKILSGSELSIIGQLCKDDIKL